MVDWMEIEARAERHYFDQGRAQGRKEMLLQAVLRLRARRKSSAEIADYLGITEKEVRGFVEMRLVRSIQESGRQEGRREVLLETVSRLSAGGMKLPHIADVLGTSVEELQVLLASRDQASST